MKSACKANTTREARPLVTRSAPHWCRPARARRTSWCTRVAMVAVSMLLAASPAMSDNLITNGEFQEDGISNIRVPAGWYTTAYLPTDWQGTTYYDQWLGGHPAPRPDGQGGYEELCFGHMTWDGLSSAAVIKQDVGAGQPAEMRIGLWIYCADNTGAFVEVNIDQEGSFAHWDSGNVWHYGPSWQWYEWTVPGTNFTGGELTVTIEMVLDYGALQGMHGMFIDGVVFEAEEVGLGACCTGGDTCVQVDDEANCLAMGPDAKWGGPGSTCSDDENNNGVIDACEICVQHDPFADADGDGDVDQADFAMLQACYSGPDPWNEYDPVVCSCYDANDDQEIDVEDFNAFEACATGPEIPADPTCDD